MYRQSIKVMTVLVRHVGPPIHDYYIQAGQHCLMRSEAFPDQTFQAIAIHRPLEFFLRNSQTQSGMVKTITTRQHEKLRID